MMVYEGSENALLHLGAVDIEKGVGWWTTLKTLKNNLYTCKKNHMKFYEGSESARDNYGKFINTNLKPKHLLGKFKWSY